MIYDKTHRVQLSRKSTCLVNFSIYNNVQQCNLIYIDPKSNFLCISQNPDMSGYAPSLLYIEGFESVVSE